MINKLLDDFVHDPFFFFFFFFGFGPMNLLWTANRTQKFAGRWSAAIWMTEEVGAEFSLWASSWLTAYSQCPEAMVG